LETISTLFKTADSAMMLASLIRGGMIPANKICRAASAAMVPARNSNRQDGNARGTQLQQGLFASGVAADPGRFRLMQQFPLNRGRHENFAGRIRSSTMFKASIAVSSPWPSRGKLV